MGSIYRVPTNSLGGFWKRSRFERSGFTEAEVNALINKLRDMYAQQQEEDFEGLYEHKRTPFSSWAGKRAPFNSWAGKRAPFNSWAGKRSSEESNELLNHGDDRFGDSPHRVKRSSGEYTENENDQNTHVRIARGASR